MNLYFIAIDKTTHQIGIFDCSPEFYERGQDKVKRAAEQYKLFYESEDFDPQQFFINQTLITMARRKTSNTTEPEFVQ